MRKGERTKDRILDAAERLFADHGYDGVSLRDVGQAAGVPIALASYYFGGKDGLYRAVFERRIAPISERRRAALRAAMARGKAPTIEEILDALARPWVELRRTRGGQHYSRLLARETADPNESRRGIVRELLDPIAVEFIAAMETALPQFPRAEIHWAYHFFIGALLLVLINPGRTRRLSGALCDMSDADAATRNIVDFFSRALHERPPLARPVRRRRAA